MNSSNVFVLLIILMVMTASVVKSYLKQRGNRPETDADAADMMTKIGELEERIQVLERIVTEKHVDLGQEIDSL